MMTDFYGYKTQSLANPFFRIDVLKNAGPRIVRLVPANTELNLLAEVPNVKWPTSHGDFYPLGGHRLWLGPERREVTYTPDHLNAETKEIENGLSISHEDHYLDIAYRRQIDLTLDPAAPQLKLVHKIKNLGSEPIPALPWAITQFKLGGRAIIPLAKEPADPGMLLPNRNLVLWPYSRLDDKRFHFSAASIMIDAQVDDTALKVGAYSPLGWAAIEFAEGWTLIKKVSVLPPEDHADMSSNIQCYVFDAFIELETLGRFTLLKPGEEITHVEEWEFKKGTLASLGLS
jgi:hypothetical protein